MSGSPTTGHGAPRGLPGAPWPSRRVWVVVAVAACFATLVAVRPFGPGFVSAAANVMMVAAPATAAVWCCRPRRSTAWTVVGAGLGLWAAGQAVWTWYEEIAGQAAPFPSLADLGYLAALPVIGVGLLAMLQVPAAGWARANVFIEAALATCASLLLLWPLTLGDLLADRSAGLVPWAVGVAYPLADGLFLGVTLLLVVRSRRRGAGLWWLAAGLVGFATSDIAFAYLTQTERYVTGGWSDAGWVIGSLLIGVAAAHDKGRGPEVAAQETRAAPLMVGALAHLVAVVALAVTAVLHVAGVEIAGGQLFLIGCMTMLMGVNQLPVLAEMNAWHTLLERRVDARTAELHALAEALRQEQRRLAYLAEHDALTDLPNRRALFDAMALPAPPGMARWVVLVDLDNFKTVNDSAGHAAGDLVLQVATERLTRVVPEGTMVARLGGDEFALLCCTSPESGAPTDVAEAILAALRSPFSIDDDVYLLDGSAGIAALRPDQDPEMALRDADVAMYAAKAAGRGRWVVHTEQMAAASLRLRLLMPDLHRAIERDEFVLHFQPVVRLDTDAVVGAEALVRWQHPTRGLLSPDEFLDFAETTGAIVAIGTAVLRKALVTLRGWIDEGRVDASAFRMNVNLSTKQLEQPGFVEELAIVLDHFDLDASLLVLEVTETSLLGSSEAVMSRLEGIREMGARLAVDDFGTGYAGFEYLKRGLFDVVKLDRSFVETGAAQRDWALARAVIGLADSMGFEVVAEGVERLDQAAALRGLGCPKAQGYLYGRPVPAPEFHTETATIEVAT